ncbi:motility protein A [Clostridium sp.]|uniref:motility protein A n=1 Tax=Clostridium sp. TaxID=1506 RepID=UPI001B48AC9E|nr:motility protein A [Clostridium sp.]MBP3917385.1 motility protein A [Clostridium sp.]
MKKYDILTVAGILSGIVLLIIGMSSGSSLIIFWDMSSVLITAGGSFCAVLITFNVEEIKLLGKVMVETFKEKSTSPSDLITMFVEFSKKARKNGLLSLEESVENIDDEFMKKGLQMIIDGFEPDAVREILELEISETENRHLNSANILGTWGKYAPAFGMLGTLIGLIQMLQNLSDVSNIASGMGKALITTFYGSLLANLFCNPMAANLKNKSSKESVIKTMVVEGILSIQSGVSPKLVEEKLLTYLRPNERKKYLANSQN